MAGPGPRLLRLDQREEHGVADVLPGQHHDHPLDQRDRLFAQSLLAAAGDVEAMEVDEDFLRALEYGMPPAGGQGMGVERVIMMLTGQNIRDTMLFPLVKPE